MFFGGGPIVDGVVADGEAVFDIFVDFDLAWGVGGGEGGFGGVVFSSGVKWVSEAGSDADVDFGFHFGGEQVRAVGLIGGEACAVEGGGGGDCDR